MLNGIVFLTILGIAVYGIKRQKASECLSVQQSNCVKGLSALILVLVHIGNSLENPGFYKLLSSGGYLLVGVFFFYSGYGIVFQSLRREGYFQKRLPRRIFYLIKMVFFTEFIYLFVNVFVLGKRYQVLDVILHLSGIDLLNGAMWYIVALIIILIAFFFVSRLSVCKDKYTLSAIIAVGIYIFISILRQKPPHEMQSCIGFALGAFMAEKQERILTRIKEKKTLFVIGTTCCIAFVISFFMPYMVRIIIEDLGVVRVVFGSLATVTFLMFMLIFLTQCSVKNRVLVFLGEISTEVYLSHQIIINVLEYFVPEGFRGGNEILISVVVISIVLALSVSINRLGNCVKRKRNV